MLSVLVIIPLFTYPLLKQRYQQDLLSVHTGILELQTAFSSLQIIASNPVAHNNLRYTTQQHFARALADFTQLQADLALLPPGLEGVPRYGSRLHSAKMLLPLATAAAQAGLTGCHLLEIITEAFHDPLTQTHGLTHLDQTRLLQDMLQLRTIFAQAIPQLIQLGTTYLQLTPYLQKMAVKFRFYLPQIQQTINQVCSLFSVSSLLLGVNKPAYYLLELLDSTELRPTGGFMGNYGIAEIAGGHLQALPITDSYLLDNLQGRQVPFPPQYTWFSNFSSWQLRDANLDADFPTSARNVEMLYAQESKQPLLSGVVALTPALIEQVLTLTGPITVPEYRETVTAHNLVERIHYHQLVAEGQLGEVPSSDAKSSNRKRFTALLGVHLLLRLRSFPVSLLPALLQVFVHALYTKDLQIYLNLAAAENVLHAYHVDGSLRPDAPDSLFIADTNIGGNKANRYLSMQISDQVLLTSSGMALHNTCIDIAWTTLTLKGNELYGPRRYLDYLRIYLPLSGQMLSLPAWTLQDAGTTLGHQYWGGYAGTIYPQHEQLTFTWSTRDAVRYDRFGWHYDEQILHQAGVQQHVALQVVIPACATLHALSPLLTTDNNHSVYFLHALNQDQHVHVDYVCPHHV